MPEMNLSFESGDSFFFVSQCCFVFTKHYVKMPEITIVSSGETHLNYLSANRSRTVTKINACCGNNPQVN